ncbi:glycosyltransferase family 4 protein [Rubrivirga sp.]|uniref:glycosyltransferase family 4 protein n=1 Tax=Rubrivirga sp. TaxID=1885344 RepID=UPI003C71E244
MDIAFVLPGPVRVPMGGAAVVFGHARRLAERGHRVTVIAPKSWGGALSFAKRGLVAIRDRAHGVASNTPYDSRGVVVWEPSSTKAVELSGYNAVIATGHQTASWVSKNTGRGVYLIQGDERALSATAHQTWSLPLVRITVSGWLRRLLEDAGHHVSGVVPNAVDKQTFGCKRTIESRPHHVVALYHRHVVKGPATLISTLEQVRSRAPSATATVIAARRPSHSLPSWVDVHVRPTAVELSDILNGSRVCLHTSTIEGWGLLPMEAAACGCAIVATSSRGPREYLTPGSSMIEVPVGDADALADGAVRLLEDEELNTRYANQALEDVARFSWESSTAEFERLLLKSLS